jgi:hypothetical protein
VEPSKGQSGRADRDEGGFKIGLIPLRDYIFENLRWKLSALLLAVLTWFSIQFAIRRGFGEWRAQTLNNQPVLVLTAPGDPRAFRIQPAGVDVVLRPRPGTLKNLSDQTVRVFVNLTDIPDVVGVIREVHVHTQGLFEVLRTEPQVVLVEQINTVKDIPTNSVTTP